MASGDSAGVQTPVRTLHGSPKKLGALVLEALSPLKSASLGGDVGGAWNS